MARRRLEVDIVGDSKSLERALGRSETRLKKFGKSVDAAGSGGGLSGFLSSSRGLGAVAGGTALAAGLSKSVAAASNLNEQMSRANVVFRTSSSEIQSWSQTTAHSMGLARDESLAFAGTFGLLFTNIGESTNRASELSRQLVRLGADLASFNNTSVEDALAAIRSGLTGEIEPLRRYGVFLSEARTRQQAMADTGKELASQLTTQDKVLARFKVLMQDTTTAQGDFERTSGSLANQTRILKAELRDLQANLGEELVPALANAAMAANFLIEGFQGVALAAQDLQDPSMIAALRDAFGQDAAAIIAALPSQGIVNRPEEGAAGRAGVSGRAVDRAKGNRKFTVDTFLGAIDSVTKATLEGIKQIESAVDRGEAAEKAKVAIEDVRRKQRDAMEDALRAQERFEDALLDRASALKNAALDALDRKRERRNLADELTEAQDTLRTALAIGSKSAIKEARRNIQDIRLDQQRMLLEQAVVTPASRSVQPQTGTVVGGGFNVRIGNITLPGVTNAQQLLRELQRISNTQSTPRRGRYGGTNSGI